jgi:GMP synthase-like glutamine amidotransferase
VSSPRLLVVQHDHVSPPGPVAERFLDHGFEVVLHPVVDEASFHTPNVHGDFPDFTQFDAIVTMGAQWSVYDHGSIGRWVLPEIDQLRAADVAGVPVLGICFGGQLLALAHGGTVARSPHPELGWTAVDSDDDALVRSGLWFQWHDDRWTLPAEALEVARSGAASQAFLLRRNLAVQFHPEFTSSMLTGWLDNGGRAEATAFGKNPEDLLAETRSLDDTARRRTHALVDGFLERVGIAPTGAPAT